MGGGVREALALTPALSRERERGRALLPAAGEGGAKRRMRGAR
jgi:hypothetical protein